MDSKIFASLRWNFGARSKFTLLELLVVVAIMVILMSLLLPSLKKAREAALGIACVSNLKNLGSAEMNYIGDNQEWFSPSFPGKDEDSHSAFYWTNLTYPYLGGTGTSRDYFRATVNPDNSVYFCQAQRPHDTFNGVIDGAINDYPSYGLNASLGGRNAAIAQSVKLTKIKNPSRLAMFADVQYTPDIPLRGFRFLTGFYFSARHPKTPNGNSNVAWADCHVSSVSKPWAVANATSGDDILGYGDFSYNW